MIRIGRENQCLQYAGFFYLLSCLYAPILPAVMSILHLSYQQSLMYDNCIILKHLFINTVPPLYYLQTLRCHS